MAAIESNVSIQGFSTITLQVPDLDRALVFYGNALGIAFDTNGNAATASLGGVTLLLHRDIEHDLPEKRGSGIELHFAVPDADAYLALLRERGVDVIEEPQDRPWGRTFHLIDPDGYAIEFVAPLRS